MTTIAMETNTQSDYETKMKEFNEFLKNNMEFIQKITPINPSISKDDEWNDPIYDHYAQIDNTGDEK